MTNPVVIGGATLYCGDALTVLSSLPDCSVHCVVTSPPYWGLRDYGVAGQLGLESTPAEYVEKMVAVFAEVRRVLRDDGTLWLNLGDSYAAGRGGTAMPAETLAGGISGRGDDTAHRGRLVQVPDSKNPNAPIMAYQPHRNAGAIGLKHKDLVGIPWRVAFALQADGWYLRQDIIWAKPNPMPESVRDRCTKAHEYLFMFAKSERYFYDQDAIKEPASFATTKMPDGWDTGEGAHGTIHRLGREKGRKTLPETQANLGEFRDKQRGHSRRHAGFNDRWDAMEKEEQCSGMRNKRSVWTVATQPFKEAHFATFPAKLIEPCILAGCPVGGTVLDPFMGSGTAGEVALLLSRQFLGIELSEQYFNALACERIENAQRQARMFA